MNERNWFTGRVAAVTGARTGLGLAIASVLGEHGAHVIALDRTDEYASAAQGQLTSQGISALGIVADVSQRSQVRAAFQRIENEAGRLDVLVSNAGIYPNTPFLDISEDEWDRVLDTNLKGTFLTCQCAAPLMIRSGGGAIVAIASGVANTALAGWSHYAVSKAGVVALARNMALELGPYGIRVNALLPGYIDVPEGGAHLRDDYKEVARTTNLRGRPGRAEDIANAVLLLVSPLADFVTGTTLRVDGGASAGRIGLRPA